MHIAEVTTYDDKYRQSCSLSPLSDHTLSHQQQKRAAATDGAAESEYKFSAVRPAKFSSSSVIIFEFKNKEIESRSNYIYTYTYHNIYAYKVRKFIISSKTEPKFYHQKDVSRRRNS